LSPPVQEYRDLRHWLMLAALGLMLGEALVTRMGWKLPEWERRRKLVPSMAKPPRAAVKEVIPVTEKPTLTATPTVAAPDPEVAENEKRRSRFARAKGQRP
jgi:hypothetical protein